MRARYMGAANEQAASAMWICVADLPAKV